MFCCSIQYIFIAVQDGAAKQELPSFNNYLLEMKRYVNLLFWAGFICIQLFRPLHAQTNSGALIAGDFADPSIIKAKAVYYATGTSSEWAPHFPIYTSKDLQNWKLTAMELD